MLKRNIELAKTNLEHVGKFVESHPCDWARPMVFIRVNKMGEPVDDVALCQRLLERTGVMFVPCSACFGERQEFQGYARVGFVCETDVLVKGLEALRAFMEDGYEDMPICK